MTVAAYQLLADACDYPLHVGVTEAGGNRMGLIKSGMGIGGLLMEGIGDTLRVSLTDEPENEVYAGYDILRAAGYAVAGPEIISCPTCGRTQYPMIEIANEVEARLRDEGFKKPLKIAIMGCVVNGPGEAREADVGLAGFFERDPATLSGGQRARVSVLRALLAEPDALLLDEPFAKLDAVLRDQFRSFVFERIARLAIPALLVTHDPDDVPAGGRVIEISEFSKFSIGEVRDA